MSKKRHCHRGRHWLLSAPDDRKGARTYNENVRLTMRAELAKLRRPVQPAWEHSRPSPIYWRATAITKYRTPAKQKRVRKLCKYLDRSFYGYTHCPF